MASTAEHRARCHLGLRVDPAASCTRGGGTLWTKNLTLVSLHFLTRRIRTGRVLLLGLDPNSSPHCPRFQPLAPQLCGPRRAAGSSADTWQGVDCFYKAPEPACNDWEIFIVGMNAKTTAIFPCRPI